MVRNTYDGDRMEETGGIDLSDKIPRGMEGVRFSASSTGAILVEPRNIECYWLDEVGAILWEMADGHRTIEQLARALSEAAEEVMINRGFAANGEKIRGEVLPRVSAFFQVLSARGFIEFTERQPARRLREEDGADLDPQDRARGAGWMPTHVS